jgi:hypothetical protein
MRLAYGFLFLLGCGGELLLERTPFEPLAHDVEVRVADGVAALTVHRAFRGIETPELELVLALPSAGAVDRFRFAVNDRWSEGELLDAELASDRYGLLSGLAGIEGHASEGATPPALLESDGAGRVRLRAHPIAPTDTIEIELRIVSPACHANGRASIDYPFDPLDPPSFSGQGTIRSASGEDDFATACDADATILEGERAVIELEPLEEVTATYAVQPLGERTAIRVAIDAPPELAPIPARPRMVFVVDGSYSQNDPGLTDQLAWAKATLAWTPDATVEVVVFRRHADRLFGRFVAAGELADAIAALPAERLAPGNGSFLDRGLELASSLLASAGGETRVVVTSDLSMRSAFDVETVTAGLGRDLVHLLHRDGPASGAPMLYASSHDDELEQIARATGGMAATLAGAPDGESAVATAEELVHPIRLDDVELIGLPDVSYDSAIDRGHRLRTTALLDSRAPDRIEVRALLWSTPVSFEIPRSGLVEDAMPAILIATAPGLTEAERGELANEGGVVSELTSYLAERGGVDPLPPAEAIGEGISIGTFTSFGTSCGCCGGWSHVRPRSSDAWLRAAVEELATACAARGATVQIETTFDEIADVSVEAERNGECLVEAIWALRLDASYRERHRTTAAFSF